MTAPDDDADGAEIRRKISGPHPHRAAHRVITGYYDGENAEAHEHQPGPEVLLTFDFHEEILSSRCYITA